MSPTPRREADRVGPIECHAILVSDVGIWMLGAQEIDRQALRTLGANSVIR